MAEISSDLVVESFKLTKIYQNRQIALNDVTLKLEPGSVMISPVDAPDSTDPRTRGGADTRRYHSSSACPCVRASAGQAVGAS